MFLTALQDKFCIWLLVCVFFAHMYSNSVCQSSSCQNSMQSKEMDFPVCTRQAINSPKSFSATVRMLSNLDG